MASPHREYLGFSQFFAVTFLIWFIVIWSILPDLSLYKNDQPCLRNDVIAFLQELVELLPQRYWIAVIECSVLMGMLFGYLGLLTYNEDVLTVPLNDIRTITDSRANVADPPTYQKFLQDYAYTETSAVLDLPISDVCKLLYESQ
ncbi:LAME_0H11980g1_1 [Lachancea meyersii CBS 8951]|uniref:Phosphatidylinositol N-acetylglucosaminyltransferase subunit GPI19 n=1 Tax=Lachancea meyersii CBS 8951 TaxID=1266667 RepID=A0A1G4KGL1_9SACH|nr:LAME_0H11980g1_1 [Lachancea meyersii CBS 8951]